jgi:hypothetical protein
MAPVGYHKKRRKEEKAGSQKILMKHGLPGVVVAASRRVLKVGGVASVNGR